MDTINIMIFLLIINIIPAIAILRISELNGPSAVQNGSTSRIVLDCIFTADESDLTGLVVKWFFNRRPFPVYQWIPGNEPQGLGILKGRLDLNHNVSSNEWSRHRALVIINPTTELSGEYTCSVSSFVAEDVRRKELVIFAPASETLFTYRKPSVSSIIVTCNAGGLFPEPEVLVFKSRPNLDRMHRNVISGSEVSRKVLNEGNSYNVTANVVLFDFELRGETVFTCEISIPGTDYQIHKELLYTPGHPKHQAAVSSQLGRHQEKFSFLVLGSAALLINCLL